MSIQDVLKKSFLNQFNSDLSTTSIVGTLILTALIGTYIFVIYPVPSAGKPSIPSPSPFPCR